MSNNKRTRGKAKQERHISVRSVRRETPDVRKLAQVLIQLVQAQAEVEAEAQHRTKPSTDRASRTDQTVTSRGETDADLEPSGSGSGDEGRDER